MASMSRLGLKISWRYEIKDMVVVAAGYGGDMDEELINSQKLCESE